MIWPPTGAATAAVTTSLSAFGVLALTAMILLAVGAARRRARARAVAPAPTVHRTDEESPIVTGGTDDARVRVPATKNGAAVRRRTAAPAASFEVTEVASAPSGTRVPPPSPSTPEPAATTPVTIPAPVAEKAPAPTKPREPRATTPAVQPDPTPPVPPPAPVSLRVTGPSGGRFTPPRRGRVKKLLDVLDVPGTVVRRHDDVAAVLTRFYAEAVRVHDSVHIVQLTADSRADLGAELHAAGRILGDPRPYTDLSDPADPSDRTPGPGLHGLRRVRVDGAAVKALRGASRAVLVVDTHGTRAEHVADAASMLDGLGVAVGGLVVWNGRIPDARP